jgi:hypothetical protein
LLHHLLLPPPPNQPHQALLAVHTAHCVSSQVVWVAGLAPRGTCVGSKQLRALLLQALWGLLVRPLLAYPPAGELHQLLALLVSCASSSSSSSWGPALWDVLQRDGLPPSLGQRRLQR